jgi:hypothetical protein
MPTASTGLVILLTLLCAPLLGWGVEAFLREFGGSSAGMRDEG